MRALLLLLLLVSLLPSQQSLASDIFSYDSEVQAFGQKSTYWHPFGSYLLPGLSQYQHGQNSAAAVYAGVGTSGLLLGVEGIRRSKNDPSPPNDGASAIKDLSDAGKMAFIGSQIYSTMGSLSAYHAFRTQVKIRQNLGEFSFLDKNETPADLMLAPFQFGFLGRPTTFIPLLAFLGAIGYDRTHGEKVRGLSGGDLALGNAVSWNAGVGEEALFRGYLMMNFRESWQSDFWSNVGSSSLFGLAHLSPSNRDVSFQTVAGFYLAWLAQSNSWSLAEGAFLHAWWDVIAIAASNSHDGTQVMLPITLVF